MLQHNALQYNVMLKHNLHATPFYLRIPDGRTVTEPPVIRLFRFEKWFRLEVSRTRHVDGGGSAALVVCRLDLPGACPTLFSRSKADNPCNVEIAASRWSNCLW